MYNASDRKDVRRAEKASAIAERNRGNVVRQIMSTTPGREFMYSFLADCHIFATPFSDNPNAMYALIGEQNAAKRLLDAVMRYSPDEYIHMLREANGRRSTGDTIDANGTTGEQRHSQEPSGGLEGDGELGQPDLFDGYQDRPGSDAIN